MNPEFLLAHFNRISDAPEAISRLRSFVLDLAIRGKLVDQAAEDEPASELLNRIRSEKARLVKQRESVDRAQVVTNATESLQFVTPRGWIVTTLGDVAHKITDGAHKTPTYLDQGVPFISVKNFSRGKLDFSHTRLISPTEHEALYKRCDPRRGDILIGRIGTLGKAVLVDTDVEFSLFVSVGLIRFSQTFIAPTYFRMLLNSPLLESEYNRIKVGGGTHTNKLNLGDLHTLIFPLPPLAEQHRIVAKVDELMALCDRLEEARAEGGKRRDQLVAVSLRHINNGESADRFHKHSHFYITNVPTLISRRAHVQQLRQAVLNLAVRGKLVEQHSTDEPASELIKRIHIDKERLIKEGHVKGHKQLPPIWEEDAPFSIPAGWQWARFIDIAAIQSNLVSPSEYEDSPHIAPDNIESGTGRLLPYTTVRTSAVFSAKHLFFRGCILYSKIRPALAKAVIVDFDGLCSADMYPILPLIRREYLHKYMLSETFVRQSISEDNRVAMPKINQVALAKIAVPVPPLAEQDRIVAKLNELMVVCDRLETQLTTTQTESRKFLDAVLHHTLRETQEAVTAG